MSRSYNQVRRDHLGANAEPPAVVPPFGGTVLDPAADVEPAVRKDGEEFFNHCRTINIAPHPDKLIIFPQEGVFHAAVDSYRTLRTRLVRGMASKAWHSVVISSPLPGEGKTLTTMNLALTCAKLEKQRILLVDSDLRTRGLSRLMSTPAGPGLCEVLEGEASFESAILSTNVPNLYVVTAGRSSGHSVEVFAGDRWKDFMNSVSKLFTVVLVDAPPILPIADFELITGGCDAVLVIVRALQTNREMLAKAVKQIDSTKFLGIIFNDASSHSADNYYGYGYKSKRNNNDS
jgi:protein-tyrosine kinase